MAVKTRDYASGTVALMPGRIKMSREAQTLILIRQMQGNDCAEG